MPTKLLLYAHNGGGLGHLSRQLKIAAFLQAEVGDLSILLLTQSSMAHAFPLPPGTDVVKLPEVLQRKEFVASKALPLPLEDVMQLRQRIMRTTALAYQPEFFLVDYSPLGVRQELLPILRALREAPRKAVIVCGLLDITGPSYIREQWQAVNAMPVLEELYDEIWVYGCQVLFDPIKEYQLSDTVAQKVKFCGYLGVDPPNRSAQAIREEVGVGHGKLVLVTVGGLGRDGFPVFDAYFRALEHIPNELEVHSVLVTGLELPLAQREILRVRSHQIARASSGSRSIRLLDFSPQLLDYLVASDVVVARGGYNTATEILSLGKQAIIVPLDSHTMEQVLRASLLEERDLARVIHPDRFSAELLAEALLCALNAPPILRERLLVAGFDLNGLLQVKAHFLRLLGR